MIDDLIKKLVNSTMARKDSSGFTYVPTAAGLQQERDNAYKDAAMTGYYAPPELTNTLDQIQANKNINMTTQDDTARANAQQQNHALYSVLKNRYGIDGEAQFNTADDNMNSQNLTSAYKGMPTMAKDQNDWTRKVQLAGLLGSIDGQDTLAKQTFDANQAYRQAQLAISQMRAARSGSGGSGGGRSSSTKKPSSTDWTAYFAQQFADGDVPLYAVEEQIKSKASDLQAQGYDPKAMIDSAVRAFFDGKFKTKKEQEDFIKKQDKEWNKMNENEIDPYYGPPNLSTM